MSNTVSGAQLHMSKCHPFLRTLSARLATMLGSPGAMKVAALLTSAQTDNEKPKPTLLTYSNLVHAVSGAVGSVIAITVFYPLDTVRTRLQVDDHRRAKHTHEILSDIVREEGILGLYRGWLSMAVTLWISNFVYFFMYHGLQSSVSSHEFNTSDPLTDLALAYIAGCVNVLLTTPLWVANTRLKLQGAKLHTKAYDKTSDRKYKGILDCLKKIIQTEGLFSLWNGTAPSLLLAANPAIQFMVYEALKRYFQRIFHAVELSGLLYFFIGAIAKAVATVLTYPLQVVQSRLRAGFAKAENTLSLLQNIGYLVRHQGIGSLYKGMEAKLFQTVLTAALMFVAYEKIAAVTFRMMGLQAPPVKR